MIALAPAGSLGAPGPLAAPPGPLVAAAVGSAPLLADLMAPGVAIAGRMAATTLRLTREAASALGGLLPAEARTEWRELENKLHAFEWFSFAGARLGLAGEPAPPLAEQARRATALADPFTGIWAMEGLGYAYARTTRTARTAAGRSLPPSGLLSAARLAGVPAAAVAPAHTGSVLAVAERLLAELERGASGDDRGLVRHWLEHCRDDLRPGYAELAAEALGLVARQLQPCRLRRLDELLAAADAPLADYLWHGVGRGLYFAPTHLLPWSGGWDRAFAKACAEPPPPRWRAAGQANAVAGLAWALTLVNLRSPAVVEAAIAGCGGGPDVDRAIAHGAAGALLVWRHWAGEDAWLARFLDHRPAAAGRDREWRRRLVDPCRAALASFAGDLRRRDHLAALFRLQVPT